MSSALGLLLAVGIGFVAGLRTMTAPAVVAWAAHLGWIHLSGTPLGFMGSAWAVGIFTLGALGEFIADQLPSTPPRTVPIQLGARIVMGLLTGACVGVAAGMSLWLGAIVGAIGTLAGTFGGYHARIGLVGALHVPDIAVGVPEDLVAVGLGLLIVSRF
jgi:uncharacterized membrane protein